MNIDSIKNFVVSKTARPVLVVKKYSPEILTGVGIVAIVSGTVVACKATLKVEAVLENHKETKDVMEAALNDDELPYTEEDYKKDQIVNTVKTTAELGKLYYPAVLLTIGGVAAILGGHNVMKKRNVALAGAYAMMEKGFNEYRDRVKSRYGEDTESDIYHGYETSKVKKTTTVDGKKVTETVEEKVSVADSVSIYAKFFDEYSTDWVRNPEMNLMHVRNAQNRANDMLRIRGHIFLNEVYDLLGIPRTSAGQVVGWVISKDGDNFVDFGLNEKRCAPFVNCIEQSVLLDFNVDGVVYDLI